MRKSIKKIWNANPPQMFNDYFNWISYILDGDMIVGYYHGHVRHDSLKRPYNETSHIVIRPDYQGRGLCRNFSKYTYDQIVQLYVWSKVPIYACRCYVQAALELGFRVYLGTKEIFYTNSCQNIGETSGEIYFVVKGQLDEEMT